MTEANKRSFFLHFLEEAFQKIRNGKIKTGMNMSDFFNTVWREYLKDTKYDKNHNERYNKILAYLENNVDNLVSVVEDMRQNSFAKDAQLTELCTISISMSQSYKSMLREVSFGDIAANDDSYYNTSATINGPFPAADRIKSFLTEYLKFAKQLFYLISNDVGSNKWLGKLLNLFLSIGVYEDEVDKLACMTLYAPQHAQAVMVIYESIVNHVSETERYCESSKYFYSDIYFGKIERLFNYNIVYNGALSNTWVERREGLGYTDNPENWFPLRKMSVLDSFEVINFTRLTEKITYELDRLRDRQGTETEDLSVGIFGKAYAEIAFDKNGRIRFPHIEALICALRKREETKNNSYLPIKYTINLYSKFRNVFEHVKDDSIKIEELISYNYEKNKFSGIIKCHKISSEDFENKSKLMNKIFENDICMFIDNIELYTMGGFIADPDLDSYMSLIRNESYTENYNRLRIGELIVRNGAIPRLSEYFNCYAVTGAIGYLANQINMPVLEALEDIIVSYNKQSSVSQKALYFLGSDIGAAENCRRYFDNLSRTEMYIGKRMYILRFGNNYDWSLALAADYNLKKNELAIPRNNTITMTFYQLVKTLSMYSCVEIAKQYGIFDENRYSCLSYEDQFVECRTRENDIIIGLNYNELEDSVKFSYYIDKANYTNFTYKKIMDYIFSLLKTIFSQKDYLYRQCRDNGFYSVLFSGLKNVNDVFFLHLFYDMKKDFKVHSDFSENVFLPYMHKIDHHKFSNKRKYEALFRLFDQPTSKHTEMLSILGDEYLEVLRNSKSLCKSYGYVNSYLGINIKQIEDFLKLTL